MEEPVLGSPALRRACVDGDWPAGLGKAVSEEDGG